jgi:hypothetical protein
LVRVRGERVIRPREESAVEQRHLFVYLREGVVAAFVARLGYSNEVTADRTD